jgi:hypothetical protein
MEMGRKMVLLAMADYADDNGGGIWPSIPTLAKKCSMGERTLQSHLAEMRAEGWLLVDGTKPVRGGLVNVYRINLEAKWCGNGTGAKSAPVQKTTESGAKSAPNPYDPSIKREDGETKNETQHKPKRSGSLSAAKTITYRDDEVPAHLRNMKAPPKKRKPFKAGQWKGYDPDPSSRHPNVKAYRRAFPFIKLERNEAKTLTNYKDFAKWCETLAYWRKGVMGQLTGRPWSARNWRGIRETYDRLTLRPPASSDVVKPAQTVEQYQPVYN